ELLESELFGYRKGAFTGAYEDRTGLFARADGGTVFLDEVGEISPAFQVKLLRVLQEGEVRPLGSARTRRVDVRIIAATNRDLEQAVRSGRFREDLYYRLAGFSLTLPPLRQRPGDVAAIARHLLDEISRRFGKAHRGFTDEALDCLCRYHWPGNVRELRNEIQRMLALADGERLGAELLRPRVLHGAPPADGDDPGGDPLSGGLETVDGTLRERVEQRILREILIRHRWNKSRAARELGLSRVGLRSKLRRYGLEGDEGSPRAGAGE
ncbi:MAG: sigma 54-interacting transcriptional regulator, partial [Candidatus Competibacterales bacterium]|nr:sigma 54-interacting transcriptional regulator [Candidatus Competibacterales bacterium]